eukprot:30827-Chlamydomonas_euryale.AAC.1
MEEERAGGRGRHACIFVRQAHVHGSEGGRQAGRHDCIEGRCDRSEWDGVHAKEYGRHTCIGMSEECRRDSWRESMAAGKGKACMSKSKADR